jgi:hypothetical protein
MRVLPLLLAFSVAALGLVALAPTASAINCNFAPSPVGGIVGRTHEYVTNVGEAACSETGAYASDVCVFVLGPHPVCYFA